MFTGIIEDSRPQAREVYSSFRTPREITKDKLQICADRRTRLFGEQHFLLPDFYSCCCFDPFKLEYRHDQAHTSEGTRIPIAHLIVIFSIIRPVSPFLRSQEPIQLAYR
jgi:hypothetical protein